MNELDQMPLTHAPASQWEDARWQQLQSSIEAKQPAPTRTRRSHLRPRFAMAALALLAIVAATLVPLSLNGKHGERGVSTVQADYGSRPAQVKWMHALQPGASHDGETVPADVVVTFKRFGSPPPGIAESELEGAFLGQDRVHQLLDDSKNGIRVWAEPTSKDLVCVLFDSPTSARNGACGSTFSGMTGWVTVNQTDDWILGLAADGVTKVSVVTDASTSPATMGDNAYGWKNPDKGSKPSSLHITYKDGSTRDIGLNTPSSN